MEVSLDQWQALVAVVDEGGYAKAAETLGKSQSAISYAIQKMETSLGIRAFQLAGRRASLTPAGELLYRRAQLLLHSAQALEDAASQLSSSWQASIHVAVDVAFPETLLFQALTEFGERHPLTRVHIHETVLSGSSEALIRREVELAVTATLPPGFNGNMLLQLPFVAVAAPGHHLHQLGRPLTLGDLRLERQLVVRDSGSQHLDAGWLGADQRWTVSHMNTSIKAAVAGLGFAWYPRGKIEQELAQGLLKPLDLQEGSERHGTLYLVYTDGDFVSPACQELGQILLSVCRAR